MNMKPTTVVIFGASGDLTQRKLVPALYNLFRKNRLATPTNIVGFARRSYDDDAFRQQMLEGVQEFSPTTFQDELWEQFVSHLYYFRGDLDVADDYMRLANFLSELEQGEADRLYYLAIAPQYYESAVQNLGAAKMAKQANCMRNIVVEKPFGHDLESAQALNRSIHEVFDENQIYRIDHYLGKETAQNILFFRFANVVFESVWNRNYIDHVQISAIETVDVGRRGGYYDQSGVLRDMFQNHIMQLLALVSKEPPISFNADELRNEKIKLLRSIRPVKLSDAVRGQYEGYSELEGVAPNSQTPTYAAIKLYIDNWRWQGVPFYLRSGKGLKAKATEVTIQFKQPPHILFDLPHDKDFPPNQLSLCIQPDEGIHFRFEAKVPDSIQETSTVNMGFHYTESFGEYTIPEAYERLIFDVLNSDASLYTRNDSIEESWRIIDPILQGWETSSDASPLTTYKIGSWGPVEADVLLARRGHAWIMGCMHD